MRLDIAFDIDGVTVDLISQLKEKLAPAKIKDRYDFRIQTNPTLSNSQIWRYIYRCYQNHKITPVFPGARELFQALFEKTYEPIYFITTRPMVAASSTFKLIKRACPVPFKIAFVEKPFKKIDYLSGYTYFVEDRRRTVLEIAESCDHIVFMPIRGYNHMEAHPRVQKIDGIHQLLGEIDRFVRPD